MSESENEKIKIPGNLEGLKLNDAPVYVHYQSQSEAQPARILINPVNRTIDYEAYPHIGGGDDPDVWYDRIIQFPIPNNVTGASLSNFLEDEEFLRLCGELMEKHEIRRDDKGRRIGVMTDQNECAESPSMAALENFISRYRFERLDHHSPEDWFYGSDLNEEDIDSLTSHEKRTYQEEARRQGAFIDW